MLKLDESLFGDTIPNQLKRRAINGALVAGASQAIKIVLQFVSVAVLARLLIPHDFGLIAMITPVIGFSILFQDFGLTQALVTARDLTKSQAAGIFKINLILSVIVALVVAMTAPVLAHFYSEPSLLWLTIGFAGQIILAGASASHIALLTRGMRFSKLAIIDITRSVIGLLAAVTIAYLYASPWALVAQSGVGALFATTLAWIMTGWRPRETAPVTEVRSMLHFGAGMTTFNLTNFLSRNADNVMIGWARGPIELGLYDRAYKLLLFPLQQINGPIGAIMVPVLSRLVGEPDRYRTAYRRTLQTTMLATVPGTLFLIASAPVLIPFVLGSRWSPAVPIFMWLGLAGVHQTISNTFGWLFVSQRRTTEYARFGIFSTITCLVAFAAGLPWGATGVAAAYALSGLVVRLPAIVWQVGRSGPVSAKDILVLAAPYAGSALVSLAAWQLILQFLPATALLSLATTAVVIFGTFVGTISLTRAGRSAIFEALAMLPKRSKKLQANQKNQG